MNITEFGQSIKAKYPQYKDMSDDELGQKMLAKYPQYHDMVDAGQPASKQPDGFASQASNFLRTLGLGIVPDIAGAGVGAAQKITQMLHGDNPIEQNPNAPVGQQFSPAPGYEQTPNPFWGDENRQARMSDPIGALAEGGKDAYGVGSWLLPEVKLLQGSKLAPTIANRAITGATRGAMYGTSQQGDTFDPGNVAMSAAAGSVLEPLAAILSKPKLFTKGGAARAAEQGATKGGSTSWNDLTTEVRQQVTDKLGGGKDVQQALNSYLTEEAPAELGNPNLGASKMLDMRRQLQARYGQSFLQKAMHGEDVNTKVANEVRRILSSRIHDVAPETILPDQLYSLYSKIGGDVPTQVKHLFIAGLLSSVLGPGVAGLVGKATNP